MEFRAWGSMVSLVGESQLPSQTGCKPGNSDPGNWTSWMTCARVSWIILEVSCSVELGATLRTADPVKYSVLDAHMEAESRQETVAEAIPAIHCPLTINSVECSLCTDEVSPEDLRLRQNRNFRPFHRPAGELPVCAPVFRCHGGRREQLEFCFPGAVLAFLARDNQACHDQIWRRPAHCEKCRSSSNSGGTSTIPNARLSFSSGVGQAILRYIGDELGYVVEE